MSTKLFVGGLPWAMDNNRLAEVFAEHGEVAEARVVLDRETGRSRGFGFVTYKTPEAATKGLELEGTRVDGRPLRVSRAQEKQRPSHPGGDRARGFDRPRDRGGSNDGGHRPPGRQRGAEGRAAHADAARSRTAWGERERASSGDDEADRERGQRKKGRGRRRGGRGGRGGGKTGGQDD